MRKIQHLNFNWHYNQQFNENYITQDFKNNEYEVVNLPHTNIELPYNNFDEGLYAFTSCYKKELVILEEYRGKLIYLCFEGVANYAKVYVNGRFVGEHKGGYTPFELLMNDFITYDGENTLTVVVDSSEREEIPPFGNVIDYLTYGGIYREVFLKIVEKSHIQDICIKTKNNLKEKKTLDIDVVIQNPNEASLLEFRLIDSKNNVLETWNENLVIAELNLTNDPLKNEISTLNAWHSIDSLEKNKVASEPKLVNSTFKSNITPSNAIQATDSSEKISTTTKLSLTKEFSNINLWDIEHPNLYRLEVLLQDENHKVLDQITETLGFREALFKADGFYLNGRKVKIRGLNRHQSFANVGYAMPKSAQVKDADILKWELGCNLARTSHYPQSKHFLNRCDEIGLLVFTEIPGWQYVSKNEEWRSIVLQNVTEMIIRDRNHPSVILWGVRINESIDDNELYSKTNELAHILDDTRQTAGVRNFPGSNLLEDVYTYNDFIHRGTNHALDKADKITKSKSAPYMVTEHNGHMFPTKSFDHEKKRLEHALRHLRVLDNMYGSDRISGSIGWCMFDYNTHKDFGSGDKICYHGVMDMFRIPKLAASVYASQQDELPIMEISSSMDIGEHAAGELGNVYVFTNCDYVKLYKNDVFIGEHFPDKARFPNLPHAPMVINDLIGSLLEEGEDFTPKNAKLIKDILLDISENGLSLPLNKKIKMLYVMGKTKININQGIDLFGKYIGNWGGKAVEYKFEGYKNNTLVKTIVKSPVKKPKLQVTIDNENMIEDLTYDVTRVVIKCLSEHDNVLHYANDVCHIKVEGSIELIGETSLALIGGVRGFYIKTNGQSGEGTITVSSNYLGTRTINVTVVKTPK